MESITNALNNFPASTPLTFTENGAVAYNTTNSYCLDLFFTPLKI